MESGFCEVPSGAALLTDRSHFHLSRPRVDSSFVFIEHDRAPPMCRKLC